MMKRSLLAIVTIALLASCKSKNPVDKCNDWISTSCTRIKECKLTSSVSECKTIISEVVDCSAVKGVNSNYGECLADSSNAACDEIVSDREFQLLPSCKKVFK
jgi:hypothetical protein